MTRAQLTKIFTAAAARRPLEGAEQSCKAHDWRQCRCFDADQLQRISQYAKEVASAVGTAFEVLCRRRPQVQVASLDQHYAGQLMRSLPASQGDYFMPLVISQEGPAGVLYVPSQTSLTWVQWLLGSVESSEGSEGLSELEEALLADCAKQIVLALNVPGSGIAAKPAGGIERDKIPASWDQTEQMLSLELAASEADQPQCKASFILPCISLSPIAGNRDKATEPAAGKDYRDLVMKAIADITVPIVVQMGTAMLKLEEVANLEVGDVVVLDGDCRRPADVLVNGRKAFDAAPIRYKGQLAVLIV